MNLQRVLRWIRVLAVSLAAAEALYLVLMNTFLSTPLFGLVVNGAPNIVFVRYARGWSFFPTRVTARDLSIRAADSNVEWVLTLDEVTFDCSLLELLRMRFQVTRARGSGMELRMRSLVESPRATDEYLRGLPPVDALPVVGIKPSEPPSPMTWSDENWHLWTVSLENVVAERVREIWVDHLRFDGDARVAGGFYLKPIRATEVRPLDVVVRRGSVTVSEHPMLDRLAMEGALAVARFDPRVTDGSALLRYVRLDLQGGARVPELAESPFGPEGSVSLRGEVEVPRFVIRVAEGVLVDGTRLDARSKALRVTTGEHVASGRASFGAVVANKQLLAQGALDDWTSDIGVELPRAHLQADSAALELTAPFAKLHAAVDIPELEIADLTALERALQPEQDAGLARRGTVRGWAHVEAWRSPARAPHVRGKAALRGEDIELSRGEWSFESRELNASVSGEVELGVEKKCELELRAPRFTFAHGGTKLAGDLQVVVHAEGARPAGAAAREETLDLAGSRIALRDASVRGGFVDTTAWDGVLSFPRAAVTLTPTPRLSGAAALDAKDANPLLDLLLRENAPHFLGGLAAMPRLAARSTFSIEPGRIDAPDVSASGGDLSLQGFFVVRHGAPRSAFVIQKGPFSAGIEIGEGGRRLRLFGLEDWLRSRERELLGGPPPGPRMAP